MHRVAAFVFGLLTIVAGGAAAAGVSVALSRQDGTVEIAASALLDTDAGTAWRVLTDYDRYVDFIPDLRVSRVVARHDGRVTVEQSGDAVLWWLRIPLDITFEIAEFPPTRVQSRAVAGSLRVLESSYLLTPAATGVRLEYTGRVITGFSLFGPIEMHAVEENITRQFRALVDAIERQGTAARPPHAGAALR